MLLHGAIISQRIKKGHFAAILASQPDRLHAVKQDNREKWQDAADAAHMLLLLADAQEQGMVEGLKIDKSRCRDVLRHAERFRIFPTHMVQQLEIGFIREFRRFTGTAPLRIGAKSDDLPHAG